jgi:hypothetical protein
MQRLLYILLFATFLSCTNNGGNSSYDYSGEEMTAIPEDQIEKLDSENGTDVNVNENIERKLIKDGRVEFETNNLSETRKIVLDATEKYNAYVSSEQEYKYSEKINITLVLRVPAEKFDLLLQESTQGVKRFDNKEVHVMDVTEEFLDIQARLKTKKELEYRYLALLKQAKDVSDILEIEEKMGQLRSDIESIEGRMKYLQSQVRFSTLTVSFYETVPNSVSFGNKFKYGFKNGWENLIWFFVGLINIWPFIIIIAGSIWGLIVYRRNRREKKKSS